MSLQLAPVATCHAINNNAIAAKTVGMSNIQFIVGVSSEKLNAKIPIPHRASIVLIITLNNFFIVPFYIKCVVRLSVVSKSRRRITGISGAQ